jgi:UDP-N-acetylmuramate dehydrogenase
MENKIEILLPRSKHNVEMKNYTSIGIGGIARSLIEVRSLKELISAVEVARSLGMAYKIFGNGTNILVSDVGFDGLVIVNRSSEIQIDKSKSRMIVDGGVPLSRMILEAASNGFSGLEAMFGIPGTVGGAIIVNAGAHNTSIAGHLISATSMVSSDKIVNVQNEWFDFGYRSSRLKYKKEDFPPVILNAIFQFQQKKPQVISETIAKYKAWREEHQPLGERTTGSVFRNPSQSDKAPEKERTAGYLLETSGAKKLKHNGVRVSKKHANWIINEGGAGSSDARKLIDEMRSLVIQNYSLTLEEEIEYFGDWR